MLIVAGLSLKNLQPRVWDPSSPYYLPDLKAVMVSYADFHRMALARRGAMEQGLHEYLGVPAGVKVYLDNGAFYFLGRDDETPTRDYDEFVSKAKPDWWPIPQDYIPLPKMTLKEQEQRYTMTMAMNLAYQRDGYTPVIHIGGFLKQYAAAVISDERLAAKISIALGGIVPNLLRAPKAMAYNDILDGLRHIRATFVGKELHVFGIGGTATLHLAALLDVDSADSSGWRNRAARGIVQLPGSGDRVVANLGSWRGREPSKEEWAILATCECPACQASGTEGLKASLLDGFCHRATHNLWILLQEARQIEEHLAAGTYDDWYRKHLSNSIYLRLIKEAFEIRFRTASNAS